MLIMFGGVIGMVALTISFGGTISPPYPNTLFLFLGICFIGAVFTLYGMTRMSCERCGTKLTDLDLKFVRTYGRLCTNCREKEWERGMRAQGYLLSLEETTQYP